MKPWEKYKSEQTDIKPWEKYQEIANVDTQPTTQINTYKTPLAERQPEYQSQEVDEQRVVDRPERMMPTPRPEPVEHKRSVADIQTGEIGYSEPMFDIEGTRVTAQKPELTDADKRKHEWKQGIIDASQNDTITKELRADSKDQRYNWDAVYKESGIEEITAKQKELADLGTPTTQKQVEEYNKKVTEFNNTLKESKKINLQDVLSKNLNEQHHGYGQEVINQILDYNKNQPKIKSDMMTPKELEEFPHLRKEEEYYKDIWDSFYLGASEIKQKSKNYFLSTLPNSIFKELPIPTKDKEYEQQMINQGLWDENTFEEIKQEVIDRNKEFKAKRDKYREKYKESQKKYNQWLEKHPEMKPPKQWERGVIDTIKDNPKILANPAYWGYVSAQSAAFTLGVMGTTLGVTAITKNPIAGMVAGVAIATPMQSQDLYEDLLANGATEEQASKLSVPLGAVIATVEVAGDLPLLKSLSKPFNQMLSRNIKREVAKRTMASFAKRGMKTFTAVEISETIEEILQGAIQDATVQTVNANREILKNIPETVVQTLMATAPMALIGAGSSIKRQYQETKPDISIKQGDEEVEISDIVAREKEKFVPMEEVELGEQQPTETTPPTEPVLAEGIEAQTPQEITQSERLDNTVKILSEKVTNIETLLIEGNILEAGKSIDEVVKAIQANPQEFTEALKTEEGQRLNELFNELDNQYTEAEKNLSKLEKVALESKREKVSKEEVAEPEVVEEVGELKEGMTFPDTGRNISALELDDGRIFYDTDALIHSDVFQSIEKKFGITADQIKDGGFIVDGVYKTGAADAKRIADTEKAKVKVEETRKADKKTKQAEKPKAVDVVEEETAKETIEKLGYKYLGVQKGTKNIPDSEMFNIPVKGKTEETTVTIPVGEVTEASIKAKVKEVEAKFGEEKPSVKSYSVPLEDFETYEESNKYLNELDLPLETSLGGSGKSIYMTIRQLDEYSDGNTIRFSDHKATRDNFALETFSDFSKLMKTGKVIEFQNSVDKLFEDKIKSLISKSKEDSYDRDFAIEDIINKELITDKDIDKILDEVLSEKQPTKPKKAKKVSKQPKPKKTSQKRDMEAREVSGDVFSIRISNIKTDTERFQPRKKMFSGKTVDKIVKDYDPNKLDPIVLFKDGDNEYILAGHSRLEAHRRLKKGSINARYFSGTEAEAIEFAQRSNQLGTANTDTENANYLRKLREDGKSKKKIVEIAKEDFGKNGVAFIEYSYLNPNGQVWTALESMQEVTDKATQKEIETIASWIGYIRKTFGDKITNLHEQELFKFLQNPDVRKKIATKEKLRQRIGAIVDNMFYDKNKAINLNKIHYKENGEIYYDNRHKEISKEIKDLDDEIAELKEVRAESKTQTDINIFDKKIKNLTEARVPLQQSLYDLQKNKRSIIGRGISEPSLFDVLDNITPEESNAWEEETGTGIEEVREYENNKRDKEDSRKDVRKADDRKRDKKESERSKKVQEEQDEVTKVEKITKDNIEDKTESKAKTLFSGSVNYETRKGLNRSNEKISSELVEKIETDGITVEQLDKLDVPVFKYATQITIHGEFDIETNGRIGGYKNLFQNKNKSLGVKYTAIDVNKKSKIDKQLRIAWRYNRVRKQGKNVWNYHQDSKGSRVVLYKRFNSIKEANEKGMPEIRDIYNTVPNNYIGSKNIIAFQSYGRIYIGIEIGLKGIYEKDIESFISFTTDGLIKSENDVTKIDKYFDRYDKVIDKKRSAKYERNRKKKLQKISDFQETSPYAEYKKMPENVEFKYGIVRLDYEDNAGVVVFEITKDRGRWYRKKLGKTANWEDVNDVKSDSYDKRKLLKKSDVNSLEKRIKKGGYFNLAKPTRAKKEQVAPVIIEMNNPKNITGKRTDGNWIVEYKTELKKGQRAIGGKNYNEDSKLFFTKKEADEWAKSNKPTKVKEGKHLPQIQTDINNHVKQRRRGQAGIPDTQLSQMLDQAYLSDGITPTTAEYYAQLKKIYGKTLPIKERKARYDAVFGTKYRRVFHGTPHKFDKFSMTAIGSGEGAQVFGYGLYFTDSKGIAEFYANELSVQIMLDGEPFTPGNIRISEIVSKNKDNMSLMKKELEKYIKDNKQYTQKYSRYMDAQKILWGIENKELEITDTGGVLEADIWKGEKEPNQYLSLGNEVYYKDIKRNKRKKDGDAIPLKTFKTKEQAEDWVKKENVGGANLIDWYEDVTDEQYNKIGKQAKKENNTTIEMITKDFNRGLNGESVYREISRELGSDKLASEFLNRAGIDGIQYKAGTLSGKQSDAYNYVVFDENAIDIVEREQYRITDFYSQLERVVTDKFPNKMPTQSVKNFLLKHQVKPIEMAWLGIDEFLEGKKSVTKEELQEFVAMNRLELEEVELKDNIPDVREESNWKHQAWGDGVWNIDLPMGNAEIDLSEGDGIGIVSIDGDEIGQFNTEDVLFQFDAGAKIVEQYLEDYDTNETKFSEYTLPGGESYREVLLTIPTQKTTGYMVRYKGSPSGNFNTKAEAEGYIENIAGKYPKEKAKYTIEAGIYKKDENFKSAHFDQPNIVVHTRLNDRTDSEGNKVLFIEEIQSDWASEGAKKGFIPSQIRINKLNKRHEKLTTEQQKYYDYVIKKVGIDATQDEMYGAFSKEDLKQYKENVSEMTDIEDELIGLSGNERVPDMPFKDDEYMHLAVKKILAMAVEQGYDKISWTTGEQQAERYSLDKHINSINTQKFSDNRRSVFITMKDNTEITFFIDNNGKIIEQSNFEVEADMVGKDLSDVLGKEMSERIITTETDKTFEGEGLKIKAKGMRVFYDEKIPNFIKKYTKKWKGKVGSVEFGRDELSYDEISTMLDDFEKYPIDSDERKQLSKDRETAPDYGHDEFRGIQPSLTITPQMKEGVAKGQELFRESTAKQLSPQETSEIQRKIERENKFLFGDARPEIRFVDTIKTADGRQALGKVQGAYMDLVKGRGIMTDTQLHESVHFAISEFLTTEEKKVLFDTGKSEEEIAEFIIEYANAKAQGKSYSAKGFSAKVRKIIDKLIRILKRLFGHSRKIDTLYDFYDSLLAGEFASRKARTEGMDLQPAMRRNTDTKAFTDWFSESKVVDENGEPLVVYRGDRKGKYSFTGKEDKSNYIQGNIFFTDNKRVAKHYTIYRTNHIIPIERVGEDKGLYSCYLSIKNPVIIDAKDSRWTNIKYKGKIYQIDDLVKELNNGINDGVIVKNVIDQGGVADQYIVFKPTQIKSIYNQGTFDPTDPDIRYRSLTDIAEEAQKKRENKKLTRATVEEIEKGREKYGLDEIPLDEARRWKPIFDLAVENKSKDNALWIANSIAKKPRVLTNNEFASLVLKKAELEDAIDDIESNLSKETRIDEVERYSDNLTQALHDYDTITEALRWATREAGRALSIVRLTIKRENAQYKLAKLLQKAKIAKGKDLTESETRAISKLSKEIKKYQEIEKKLQYEISKLQEKLSQRDAKRNFVKTTKAIKTKRASAKLNSERKDLFNQLEGLGYRLNDVVGLTYESAKIISKIAVNYFESGITDINKIAEEIQTKIPDITKKDVYDSVGGRIHRTKKVVESDIKRQIRDLKTQARLLGEIEDAYNGIFTKGKAPVVSEAVKTLRRKLNKLKRNAENTIRDDEKLRKIQINIDNVLENIRTGLRDAKKTKKVESLVIQEARQDLSELRRLLTAQDKIADLENQIKTGNFKVPVKIQKVIKNEELIKAQVKLTQLRREARELIHDMRKRTKREWFIDIITMPRSMMATADMSGVLRQGAYLSTRHPIMATKVFGQSFQSFFSQNKADEIDVMIRKHENQPIRDKAGLFLSSLDHVKFTEKEEAFVSNLAVKIPVYGKLVKASERQMVSHLNLIRASIFDNFLNMYPDATDEQLKAWARFINIASGRGEARLLKVAGEELSMLVFAPKFSWSRIQLPYQQVLPRNLKHSNVSKEIAKNNLAFISTVGTALLLLSLAGAEVGTDPEDSDFLKVKIGNTRIDLFGGMLQPIRLKLRILLTALDTAGVIDRDKKTDLRGAIERFVRYKSSPTISIPFELAEGKDVIGREREVWQTFMNAVSPLVTEEIIETYLSNPALGIILAPFILLGISIQTYERGKKSSGTLKPVLEKAKVEPVTLETVEIE